MTTAPRQPQSRLVTLRPVEEEDLEHFFRHQRDPEARRMAAFTSPHPDDRIAFLTRWTTLLADRSIVARTILLGETVAGHVASFVRNGDREVTFWIGREHWGRGIASAALGAFLAQVPDRPLYARAAEDNAASLRVLAKHGFTVCAHERALAHARGHEIEEVVLVLRP